jgi:antibiotic biosynthesis monooxygenase
MPGEFLSIAFVEPLPGREEECVVLIRELIAVCARKGYSRDVLYHDTQDPGILVDLRHWNSAEARAQAHEDPDLHRFWRQLAQVCRVQKIYEALEPV